MSKGVLYLKMFSVGAICCIGGPALMYYVTPDEGELFKRFNPELQKYNLENRDRRVKEYNEFLAQLQEYSKSDKPIWEAAAEAQAKQKQKALDDRAAQLTEQRRLKDEIRSHANRPG